MTPVIELRGITKRFGPVEVLSEVDLALHAGRVHSLAGENGAGKSTLVKILGGIYQPDSGRILERGNDIGILGVADATRHGIAVVHQHPALFPDLSVAENIFPGRQPRRGQIDWAAMRAQARELLARLSVDVDVGLPVKMLGIAERHAIEIARALSRQARVLIMDEPTSAISGREVARLFEIVGRLKQEGVAILFISHFIDEILGWGDDVTVLRSGRRVVTAPASELTPELTVRHMIGSEPGALFPKEMARIGAPILTVAELTGAGFVEDVSFELRTGEILGFFGLVGSGRSEVAEMLFGITTPERGEICIEGRAVSPRWPADALRLGISLLPEDRHQQGLVLPFLIRANATLPILSRLCGALGLVDRRQEASLAGDFVARMRVVARDIEQPTNTLSGGNQQKVLLAKWLIPTPKILILDQPTRGIDVGAKAEIHRIVSHLAAEGMAIILISDDAAEAIAMADRIIVFRGGRVAGTFTRDSIDREAMMLAAAHTARDSEGSRVARIARTFFSRSKALAVRPADGIGGFVRRLGRVRERNLVLALLLISAAVSLRAPRFLEGANLEQVALSATLVCIVVLGEALVIIARQIDLSVGAIVAVSAFVSAGWLEHHPGTHIIFVFLLGCAVGSALGVGNALLVAVARIPAIVATLGTVAIYRGGAIALAGGREISATALPGSYQQVAQIHVAGMPLLVWLAILLTALLGWAARYTRTGRNLYALGSSPESARIAGINEAGHLAFVFILSGLLCGLVGVLWGARFGTVDAVIAPNLNLQAISAAVIGGVSIFGGSGSVYGAAIGSVILAVLDNGVQLLGINQFWLEAVIGAAILGTAMFYSVLARRAERAERQSRWQSGADGLGALPGAGR